MSSELKFDQDQHHARKTSTKKESLLVRLNIVKNEKQALIVMVCFILFSILFFFITNSSSDSLPSDISPRNTPSGIEL